MASKNQQRKAKLQKKIKPDDDVDKFLDDIIAENKTDAQATAETAEATKATGANKATEALDATVPRQKIIEKAGEMWKTLKAHVAKDPDFKKLPDQDKLDTVRTKFGYAIFMEEFPIVSRYMICYGQYSSKAFERMLRKIETTVHPPPDKRDKNYMEDQWVRRQADYVQYLWESYQKHYKTAEREYIWQTTYDRLRKEFDDFRTMHKDIEERVANERKTLAGQNARELFERLLQDTDSITPEERERILKDLEEIMNKKNDPEPEPEPVQKPNDEPQIVMIETVDVERMHEIDDKYKPEELRGMEPVLYDADTVGAGDAVE